MDQDQYFCQPIDEVKNEWFLRYKYKWSEFWWDRNFGAMWIWCSAGKLDQAMQHNVRGYFVSVPNTIQQTDSIDQDNPAKHNLNCSFSYPPS